MEDITNNNSEEGIIRIKAQDLDECDMISALLQDSIVKISECHFFEEQKCFRLLLNRFCWEHAHKFEEHQSYHRVHSGLYIHNVKSVILTHMKNHHFYNLLAMHASSNEINLLFSDHKHICIEVDGILVYLKDLHEKYPTLSKPEHNLQAAG